MPNKDLNRWFDEVRQVEQPDFYFLLGLEPFESDPDKIANAVDERVDYLQVLSHGNQVSEAQKLLNLIAQANLHLKDREKKAVYDQGLAQTRSSTSAQATKSPDHESKPVNTAPVSKASRGPDQQKVPRGKSASSTTRPQTKSKSTWIIAASALVAAATLVGLVFLLSKGNEQPVARQNEDSKIAADDPLEYGSLESRQNSRPVNSVEQPSNASANASPEKPSETKEKKDGAAETDKTSIDQAKPPEKQAPVERPKSPDDSQAKPENPTTSAAGKTNTGDSKKKLVVKNPERVNFSFGHKEGGKSVIQGEVWNKIGHYGRTYPIQNAEGSPIDNLKVGISFPSHYNSADKNGKAVLPGMDEVMSTVLFTNGKEFRLAISGLPPKSKWDVAVYVGLTNQGDRKVQLNVGGRTASIPSNYCKMESQPAEFHRLAVGQDGCITVVCSAEKAPFLQGISIAPATKRPPLYKPVAIEPNQLTKLPSAINLPDIESQSTVSIGKLDLSPGTELSIELATIEATNRQSNFSIAKHPNNEPKWSLFSYFDSSKEAPRIAELTLEDGMLGFRWLPKASEDPDNNRLRNSVIKLSLNNGASASVNLRTPVKLNGFSFKDGDKLAAKINQEIPWLPRAKNIRTELVPFNEAFEKSYCDPGSISRSPGMMFFSEEADKRFFWIEVNRKLSRSLTLEAELRNLINGREKQFSRKTFVESIEQLRAANTEQAKKFAAEGERYLGIVDKLINKPIPVTLSFVLEGRKVVIARTFGRFSKSDQNSIVIEGESLKYGYTTPKHFAVQRDNQFGWSQSGQVVFAGEPEKVRNLFFEVPASGKYSLHANLTKAVDYGSVELSINQVPCKQPFDQFLAEGVGTELVDLGVHALKPGLNELKVKFAAPSQGAQPTKMFGASKGTQKAYLFGLDFLQLKKLDP